MAEKFWHYLSVPQLEEIQVVFGSYLGKLVLEAHYTQNRQ